MNKETYLTEYPKHESMRENVKKDKNRLHFHMMPPTGWMNDPNGLCEFQGVNHIYFQYTPFLAGWGTKLWGHYTTKDWIHYKEEEPFLYPDEEWDRDKIEPKHFKKWVEFAKERHMGQDIKAVCAEYLFMQQRLC